MENRRTVSYAMGQRISVGNGVVKEWQRDSKYRYGKEKQCIDWFKIHFPKSKKQITKGKQNERNQSKDPVY